MTYTGVTIAIDRWQWFDEDKITHPDETDAYPGCDGAVWYLLLRPCDCKKPCEIDCLTHPKEHHHYLLQPFARDGVKFMPGSTVDQQRKNQANIWKWDGNYETPTITPSFLAHHLAGDHWPRVHLYVTRGEIDLLTDSGCKLRPRDKCVERTP